MKRSSYETEDEKSRRGHVGFADVKVGVNFLDVVVIFERFYQTQHLLGVAAFELDVVLRHHGDFGDLRLDAGGFE